MFEISDACLRVYQSLALSVLVTTCVQLGASFSASAAENLRLREGLCCDTGATLPHWHLALASLRRQQRRNQEMLRVEHHARFKARYLASVQFLAANSHDLATGLALLVG